MMRARQPDSLKSALDLQIFAPSILADSEGLAAALRMLESCLAGPDIPLDLIVQDLCVIPNLFEFIVSGEFPVLVLRTLLVSDLCLALPSAEGLVHRILDTYPTDPALVEASSTSMLLRRLSPVISTLPPDLLSADTIRRRIERHKVYVEDAMPVLTLSCCTDFSRFSMGNKKQKRKNKNTTPTIDMTPFRKLGAKVPSNNVEASQMARKICDDLKMILNVR